MWQVKSCFQTVVTQILQTTHGPRPQSGGSFGSHVMNFRGPPDPSGGPTWFLRTPLTFESTSHSSLTGNPRSESRPCYARRVVAECTQCMPCQPMREVRLPATWRCLPSSSASCCSGSRSNHAKCLRISLGFAGFRSQVILWLPRSMQGE